MWILFCLFFLSPIIFCTSLISSALKVIKSLSKVTQRWAKIHLLCQTTFFILNISPSDLQALKALSVFLLTFRNGSFSALFVAVQVPIHQLLLIQTCFFAVLFGLLVKILKEQVQVPLGAHLHYFVINSSNTREKTTASALDLLLYHMVTV